MRGEFSAVRAEMAEQGAGLSARLEARIDEQGVTLATQMRVLHEDLIARIALLREGLNGAAQRRSTLSRRSGSPSVPRRRRKK
jgi:hypothetical protein